MRADLDSARFMKHRRTRGGATVEFALVVPLLITMILFSLFFTELIHARLELQEASRYAAWELTSYNLDDLGAEGNPDPQKAFEIAKNEVVKEATDRYKDLDSIEDNQPFSPFADYDGIKVTATEEKITTIDKNIDTSGVVGTIVSGVNKSLSGLLGFVGFDPYGKVEVTVTANMHPKMLPRHYLDEGPSGFFESDQWGGIDLSTLKLKNRYTMIASSWALPDGADDRDEQGRAGWHESKNRDGKSNSTPSGLWRQVNRMSFLGLKNAFETKFGGAKVINFLGKFLPNPVGTYVVSHAYWPITDDDPLHGSGQPCNKPTFYEFAHGGLADLDEGTKGYPGVDFDKSRCYDTSPFRDRGTYGDSLYIKMFKARGSWFMGCKNPQADDPAHVDRSDVSSDGKGDHYAEDEPGSCGA